MVHHWRAGQLNRARHLRHGRALSIRQIQPHAARDDLRIGKRLVDGVDRAIGHASGVQRGQPFIAGAGDKHLGQ